MTKNLGTPWIRTSPLAQPCCSAPARPGERSRRDSRPAGGGAWPGCTGTAGRWVGLEGGSESNPPRCSVGAVAALLPKEKRGSGDASAKRHSKKAKSHWLGGGWGQVKEVKDQHLG